MPTTEMSDNPLPATWSGPFGLPPFAEVKPEHFLPAVEHVLEQAKARYRAIAEDSGAPTFENTILEMQRIDLQVGRPLSVFYNLAAADTNPDLQEVERTLAPILSKYRSEILTDPKVFARIDALNEDKDALDLTDEQQRVLFLIHRMFVRAGAKLSESERTRMGEIMSELASLGTSFGQNVLAEEQDWVLPLENDSEVEGLPQSLLDAARSAAKERNLEAPYAITLSRSLIEPFLRYSSRRDLRETAYHAWASRGQNGNANDNRAIVTKTLALRTERANLLGYKTFADFKLDTEMAKTPETAKDLLDRVWKSARGKANEDAEKLQDLITSDGENFTLATWDWRYYAEKRRQAEHDFDESAIKPFFQLDKMREASFEVARRLFGLSFEPLSDAVLYHPDAKAWEVRRGDTHLGVFISDDFARASKRSGAWASGFRNQHRIEGDVRPIIVNVQNFAKAPDGQPTLLTLDDARTLFHEFGHALHGLLSDVTYPFIAGTSVARDFVELPSQLYEHWLTVPDILKTYAVHYETGESLPEELLERLLASRNFDQGFSTVEYTASALVDLAFHSTGAPIDDPIAFEADVLATLGMPDAIGMRHRTPHFAHVFSGDGYSSGYYSYMWSEVMDADAFEAFEETGNPFDQDLAQKLHDAIYSAGGRQAPDKAYRAFRGDMPNAAALLRKRGLDEAA
ncbi:MAG: M3 family metallopeptidase [Pseudomonadota bacterium]